MVISKRCKICTTLDASNILISGEYFGKQIPDLIEKLTGIELDPRKVTGVHLCQQCSIMLVHTEAVIDKLRKSMQRLQKPNKKVKAPRTISKESSEIGTETSKKSIKTKTPKVNSGTGFRKIADETSPLNGEAAIEEKGSPTKNAKRKLAYQEEMGTEEAATVETGTKEAATEETGTKEAGKTGSVSKKSKRTSDVIEHSVETALIDLDKSNGPEKKFRNISISFNDVTMDSNITMNDEQTLNETKTKDLNCVLCGKQFNQKRTLREHIESSHMGEKLKECPNCFMEFRSVQKYDSHVFNEKCKSTLYPCQYENCNRRFKNSHRMEEHMKDKHLQINGTEAD